MLVNNEMLCLCGHTMSDHASYNDAVIGPYCTIKKCSCHLFYSKPPPPPTDGYSICRKAIETLLKDGWCQGTGLSNDGKRDIVTAIDLACEWKRDRMMMIMDRIFTIVPELLMKWNDRSGRTMQDCIDLLTITADSFKTETTNDDNASQELFSSLAGDASDPECHGEGCS